MATQSITYTKLADREVSFGLLRTNPKLTSNVKLTVDSDNRLWLNSIDANEQLRNQKYKRFAIDSNSNHAVNLHKFYDSGKTPTKISFELGSTIRTDVVANDLKDQYDFDLYSSGAKYLNSKLYSEKFCYFAPLYIDQVLPEYFVIFKIPGASNYTAGEWNLKISDPNFSQTQFALDLFSQATIVKSFNIGETSNLGTYIRKFKADPLYSKNPLYVNFKYDKFSVFRGLSIKTGTHVEIPEKLDSVFESAIPQLKLEKYITEGFERNNIVYPRVLNLEFLFNDETSDPYTFNRYFGFYCNAIDLANFEIDLKGMFENPDDNDNPLPKVYDIADELSIQLENSTGVVLRAQGLTSQVSDISKGMTDQEHMFFPYLKTKGGTLHFLNLNHENTFKQTGARAEFRLDDTQFDLGLTFGPGDLVAQEKATASFEDSRSTLAVTLTDRPNHLDTLRIYHQNGSLNSDPDVQMRYDDLIFVQNYFNNSDDYRVGDSIYINLDNDQVNQSSRLDFQVEVSSAITSGTSGTSGISSDIKITWTNPNLKHTGYIVERRSNQILAGTAGTSGTAGASSSNYLTVATITDPSTLTWTDFSADASQTYTYRISTTGLIQNKISAELTLNANNAGFTFYSPRPTDLTKLAQTIVTVLKNLDDGGITGNSYKETAFIQTRAYGNMYGQLAARVINLTSTSFIKLNGGFTDKVVYADGGFLKKPHPIIPAGNIQKLNQDLSELLVKTDMGWAGIMRISQCSDGITNALNSLTEASLPNFLNRATLMLVNDEPLTVEYSKIEIRKRFKPSIGVLSLFEIKDFNFNVHQTDYSRIPDIDLFQNYYIPSNTKILDFTKYVYQVLGEGSIMVNDIEYIAINTQYVRGVSINSYVWQHTELISEYTVLTGDPVVVIAGVYPKNQNLNRFDIARLDEDLNLQSFSGFFSFGANHSTPNESSVNYEFRDKYIPNNLLSEYHVYLEKFSTEFANDSSVIPYISKWGILDSTDSRFNPYRLNTDISFGKDNFGPSHRETLPTPEKLTHEWFYIESDFNYSLDESLIKKNFYYFNEPLSVSRLINEADYFEKYFTYIPKINIKRSVSNFRGDVQSEPLTYQNPTVNSSLGDTIDPNLSTQIEIATDPIIELDRPQFRYSKLIKDAFSKKYETVFNGAKFIFSELDSTGLELAGTTRFDDYNFSIMLKPIKEDLANPQLPIQYRVIENREAKSILILIELAVSSVAEVNQTLLLPNNSLPDNRLDQTRLFVNSSILKNPVPLSFKISAIYKTADSNAGDAEFASIRNTNSLDFDSVYGDLTPDINGSQNSWLDPITRQDLGNYSIQSTDIIIIEDSPPGGATPKQFIFALKDSDLYKAISNGRISNGSLNPYATINNRYQVNQPIPAILPGQIGSKARQLFNDSLATNGGLIELRNDEFVLNSSTPSYLSIFGDYRIRFIQAEVSNLSYNFLYSARDKKYSSTKGAFSTVKLVNGVDLSSLGLRGVNGDQEYFMDAKSLSGLQSVGSFTLEDFINPLSGAHDTVSQNFSSARYYDPPLPAFAPIMTIDDAGQVLIALKTSSDFNITPGSGFTNEGNLIKNIQLTLSIPSTTSDLIKSVRENVLNLDGFDTISQISTNVTETSYGGQTGAPIDLSTDYISNNLFAAIELPLLNGDSAFLKGDFVTVSAIGTSGQNYFKGLVTEIALPNFNLSSGEAPNPGNYLILVELTDQTDQATNSTSWQIDCARAPILLKPTIEIAGNVLNYRFRADRLPGNTSNYWLNQTQQFQLFGGKDYFLNLFQNLSFAKFAKLLEIDSDQISWESYSNGVKAESRQIKIQVGSPDIVQKFSMVNPVVEKVETKSKAEDAGVKISEVRTQNYEVNRYSGEYDVIYQSISGFKYSNSINDFDLSGANVRLNNLVSNFFVLPEFYFVKYANQSILDLEQSEKYEAKYPLIGESPIDRAQYNVLSSSWDANYHYLYSGKSDKIAIPGSKRVKEDYSFVSKLLNVPLDFIAESFYTVELNQRAFEISDSDFSKLIVNGLIPEIAYCRYDSEFRLKINLERVIAKSLILNGIRSEFQKFFRDETGEVIDISSKYFDEFNLEDYMDQYCKLNLVQLYTLDQVEFYEDDATDQPSSSIQFFEVPYSQLSGAGYRQLKNIKINNTGSSIITAVIPKRPNSGIKLVPKLKIKYI